MISKRRSALYLPASNAKALAKSRQLACDVVILDLEDAVAPGAKAEARAAAVAAVAEGGFGARELLVRVNGPDTPYWGEDVAALAGLDVQVLVPKVGDAAMLAAAAAAMPGRRLWAMIETPRAILDVAGIAAVASKLPLAGLVIGTNDLAKEIGCRLGASRRAIHAALTLSVCAARANGIAIFDGVYNDLSDDAGFERECGEGVEFGFDGKTLIHPRQIDACNRLFSPTDAELAWARGVATAFADPRNANVNALAIDGRMVERLHLDIAERLLARA